MQRNDENGIATQKKNLFQRQTGSSAVRLAYLHILDLCQPTTDAHTCIRFKSVTTTDANTKLTSEIYPKLCLDVSYPGNFHLVTIPVFC